MSASASKKKRKELEGQGLSAKNNAGRAAHESRSKMLRSILVVCLAIIVCAAAVFAVVKLVNRPSFDINAAVVTVGSEKISVPVYNYFYTMTANQINSYYSQYIQSGVPVSQQSSLFGEGSMEDFFKESTNSSLESMLNVVAKARADSSYSLSEEDKASIKSSVEELKQDYEQYKDYYPTMKKYFEARFGEGCNLENFEEYLTLTAMYSGYLNKLQEEYKPSAEELEETYQKDKTAYDTVVYTYALSEAEATQPEENAESSDSSETQDSVENTYTDEAKAAARAKAEENAKNMPEDSLHMTNSKSSVSATLNEEIADWLFDDARKEGDVKVFASNEAEVLFYTVRFDRRETNDYCLVNANIITIAKDAEGTELAEDEKSAEQKRDDLIAAIQDGMTDEAFAEAAQAQGYSTSASSVSKAYSVEEIVAFLYDENRKDGDLLTSFENESYYYIVRYASKQDDTYRNQMIRSNMWSDYYTALTTENELQVDENMMQYANTDVVFYNNNSSES